ncbi:MULTISPECIES: homoserine kinase [unclassified Paenibacillus]|uniref:homoserine kinase n=1 Tax=unclassified Paenibacillus TaxID=185978 RepID=UPI000955659A|nr:MULTISPECIES: homoserine kinase [unclassified Paenibacillus]SIQ08113.1 homoserine kinase [Paenibacillus sp. RU4X]SIQ28197.1 homoserine kinase [Paenibacillus sp. RU4T]
MGMRSVLVRVPASTANLGPGFDCLGMALSLYTWIGMKPAEKATVIRLHGEGLEGIPLDKSNLIYEVAQLVFQETGTDLPELEIDMYSDIPLTRGLGSSASAIVGALTAASELAGGGLDRDALLQIAARLEGHPDNVGASLFGGIIAAAWDGTRADCLRIEPPAGLAALVAVPRFQLSTEKARHALPERLAMSDAVHNIGRSSLLVAALAGGRLDMIRHAMKDKLHQPYRAALIPGMAEVLEGAADHGALGAALSGAGPTLLALIENGSPRTRELEAFLLSTLSAAGVEADLMLLQPDSAGAAVLEGGDPALPFVERIKGEVHS